MPFSFTKNKLVLCEGKTDKRFFDAFLRTRGVEGFDVYYPQTSTDMDDGGGIDKIGAHLRLIGLQEDFIENVRSVVIAADNDDGRAFTRVLQQIVAAGYTEPKTAAEMVETRGKPKLGIIFLPEEPPGCLETLCRAAAETKWPELSGPLDTFIAATPAAGWGPTKQAKTAMECILAVTCEKQPEVDLGNIWQKNVNFHIPLSDGAFDYLELFLRTV